MVTTYDSEGTLLEMYQPSISRTLKDLKTNKAKVYHNVDANHLENLPTHE